MRLSALRSPGVEGSGGVTEGAGLVATDGACSGGASVSKLSRLKNEGKRDGTMAALRSYMLSNSERRDAQSEVQELEAKLGWFGPQDLLDEELVAFLMAAHVSSGALQFARRLLKNAGGLVQLTRLSERALIRDFHVPAALAAALSCHSEVQRRLSLRSAQKPNGTRLTPEAVGEWAQTMLSALEHEEVWLLHIGASSAIEGASQVARGGAHGCALLPKDILRVLVRGGAAAFVLVHNHPSGDPRPSAEDIDLTAKLIPLAAAIGCPLLDHVIVGRGSYRSLRALDHCFDPSGL